MVINGNGWETNGKALEINGSVKLANSASPSKFCKVKFKQKTGLENDKMCFHKEKLNAINTVYEKHILLFSRPVFLWEFDLAEFERWN